MAIVGRQAFDIPLKSLNLLERTVGFEPFFSRDSYVRKPAYPFF
jgi:hypothetical protein